MHKTYWLGRKRASLKMAQNAASPEARLTHYELADRYGAKAVSAETQASDLAESLPPAINGDDSGGPVDGSQDDD